MPSGSFRESKPTHIPGIPHYVFNDPEASDLYESWRKRLDEIMKKAHKYSKNQPDDPRPREAYKSNLTPEELEEARELKAKIKNFKEEQREKVQSVLSRSDRERFLKSGTDSSVFEYELDHPEAARLGNYVNKYSSPAYPAQPETVQYLQKKYQILRNFMKDLIPRSFFILGERRLPFKGIKTDDFRDKRTCAITIQRRVNGKTFADMTPEERSRPEVAAALAKAHGQYVDLKSRVAQACEHLGLPEDTMDVKLDIGHLSKHKTSDEIDPEMLKSFDSPNVMYDEARQRIYFIDFGLGDWDPAKEQVFKYLMETL